MAMKFNDDGFGHKIKGIASTMRGKGSPMAVKETLQEALQISQQLVPVKTGALHDSGRVKMDAGGQALGAVIYEKRYAQFIEFRVKAYLRPAMMRARLAPSLRRNTQNTLKTIIKRKT